MIRRHLLLASTIVFPLLFPMVLTYDPAVMDPSTEDHILRSVHVVFRHGDSVPAISDFNTVPSYPDAPHDFDPRAHSDLTNIGRMRAYKLGQYLRSRYDNFLGKEYRREDVYARSSYVERARASSLLALAGLYPPGPMQRWHPSFDWQPISVESPRDEDDPLMWGIGCPMYQEEQRRVEGTPEFAAAIQSLVNFFVELEKYKNPKLEFNDEQLTYLHHNLRASAAIPNVFRNVSASIIRNVAVLRYHAQNYSHRLRQLNGGPLLKKILDDMQATIDKKLTPKISLYGGQEFNVVGLLWALDAWKPIIPTYGTAVILELWQKDANHYVRVLYRDGLTGHSESRVIDGSNTMMCRLELFRGLRHTSLPQDVRDCYADGDGRRQCNKDFGTERKTNDV